MNYYWPWPSDEELLQMPRTQILSRGYLSELFPVGQKCDLFSVQVPSSILPK